jgi:hypothetical protein
LGEAGGINLYAFVGNNPVNWVDPWGLMVDNSSSCMVYFKPAGKNDYPETILDESSAIAIPPNSCSFEPVQDGIAVPCHPEHPNEVLKTVNGVNVKVNPDSTMTLFHGWRPWRWGLQKARGGWKPKSWISEDKDKPKVDWKNLFDKTGKENCQCEEEHMSK